MVGAQGRHQIDVALAARLPATIGRRAKGESRREHQHDQRVGPGRPPDGPRPAAAQQRAPGQHDRQDCGVEDGEDVPVGDAGGGQAKGGQRGQQGPADVAAEPGPIGGRRVDTSMPRAAAMAPQPPVAPPRENQRERQDEALEGGKKGAQSVEAGPTEPGEVETGHGVAERQPREPEPVGKALDDRVHRQQAAAGETFAGG